MGPPHLFSSVTYLYILREGIVSVAGYAAIYLAGVNWGHYLVNAETSFRAHYAHIAKDFCESNSYSDIVHMC